MFRRLIRYTLNALTLLSALLFVAVCAMWLRRGSYEDKLVFETHGPDDGGGGWVDRVLLAGSARDGLTVYYSIYRTSDPAGVALRRAKAAPAGPWKLRFRSDALTPKDKRAPRLTKSFVFGGGTPRRVKLNRPGGGVYEEQWRLWDAVAPHWAGALVTGAAPALWACARLLRRPRRSGRRRRGQCPACGYDLTGNASGTCPECGTPTPKGDRA